MNTKRQYISPECELTVLHAEPLLAISDPTLDQGYSQEMGLNKTELYDETEEGIWE